MRKQCLTCYMGDNYTKLELMKQQILTIGFVMLSFLLPLRATAANFSQIYVFGDSLSDIGNSFNTKRVPPAHLTIKDVLLMVRFG